MAANDRLVFYESAPMLRDMTAEKVVVDLWAYFIDYELTSNVARRSVGVQFTVDLFWSIQRNIRKVIDNYFEVPGHCADRMKKHVQQVSSEVSRWIEGHCGVLFTKLDVPMVEKNYLTEIILRPNGEIDYVETASEILKMSDTMLDSKRRFTLACEYCMENEILSLWSQLKEEEKKMHYESPTKMTEFWLSLLNNGSFPYDSSSYWPHLSNVSAIRFFYDRLTQYDRVVLGSAMLEDGKAAELKYLISRLEEPQQRQLLTFENNRIAKAMKCFAASRLYVEYAFQTWTYAARFIDGVKFYATMLEIKRLKLNCPTTSPDFVRWWIMKLWKLTPDHLKQVMFEDPVVDFIDKFFTRYDRRCEFLRDDRDLIEVFSDVGIEYRMKYWRRSWLNVAKGSRPGCLREIMHLCLGNDAEEWKFYKEIIPRCKSMRTYWQNLLENGKFSCLNEFFALVASEKFNPTVAKRRMLFELQDITMTIMSCERNDIELDAMGEFVEDAFADDVDLMLVFKEYIILGCFDRNGWYVRRNMDLVLGAVQRLCSGIDSSWVKNEIIVKCRSFPMMADASYVETPECRKMLLWCLGSDEMVDRFKASL